MHLLTQSALLRALGWTLFNSLWQMGLLWLAYVLLIRVFNQAPARFRHGLALVLLAFGVLGSVVTFGINYFSGGGESPMFGDGLAAAGRQFITEVLPYCSSLYLLVLCGLLIRYSHQYIQSRRLTHEGLSRVPAEFRVFVEATARRMGIHAAVGVNGSALVDVPLTLGFLKPVILLPVAMISQLTTQQVEAILIHELAHIRRKDYLVNLGVTMVGVLYFFNPFARMLIRDLQREREHCCDDEVLQWRYDPHAYVSALLSLARQHRPGRLALAATGGGDEMLLLQRARKILQQKQTHRRPGVRPFILLFLTAAMTVLSLAGPVGNHSAAGSGQPLAGQQQPAAIREFSKEMVFIPIVNIAAPASRQLPAAAAPRPGTTASRVDAHNHRKPHSGEETDDQVLSEAGMLGSVASTGGQPETAPFVFPQPVLTVTSRTPAARRDYSLGQPAGDDDDDDDQDADPPATESLVFVPNSSFSFKTIDTLRPQDKISWLEESTEKEIRAQVGRMQKELEAQLELLRRQEAQARTLSVTSPQQLSITSQQQLKKLLNDQLRLQQDYLKKLDQLQLRLKKTGRRLTTVYI